MLLLKIVFFESWKPRWETLYSVLPDHVPIAQQMLACNDPCTVLINSGRNEALKMYNAQRHCSTGRFAESAF